MERNDIKKTRLKEIATIERAHDKKKYPEGTILIPLSGVDNDTAILCSRILLKPDFVSPRYACVIANTDIPPYYLFAVIQSNLKNFIDCYKQTINLPFSAVEEMLLIIHTDKDKRERIGKLFADIDEGIEQRKKYTEKLKDIKKYYIEGMFP